MRWRLIIAAAVVAIALILLYWVTKNPRHYPKERLKTLLLHRKNKDLYLKTALDSPIPAEERPDFEGLHYFPPDGQWIIYGRFVPLDTVPDTLLGGVHPLPQVGYVEFTWKQQRYRLNAYQGSHPHELFIPFKDATSGKTTYAGGRYLNAPLLKDSVVVLDFNYAYHPYCVYNPRYLCPAVPEVNRLPFAVEAGERLP